MQGQGRGVRCVGPGRGTGYAGWGLRGWGMHGDKDAGMRTRGDKGHTGTRTRDGVWPGMWGGDARLSLAVLGCIRRCLAKLLVHCVAHRRGLHVNEG